MLRTPKMHNSRDPADSPRDYQSIRENRPVLVPLPTSCVALDQYLDFSEPRLFLL